MDQIFCTTDHYCRFFDRKLLDLLAEGGETEPGMLNCACANAFSSEEELERLGREVMSCYASMCELHPEYFEEPADVNQQVLQQIHRIGIDQIPVSNIIPMGPYEVVVNSIRALRPTYGAAEPKASIFEPFDPDKFNFRKSAAYGLTFWEGDLANKPAALVFNMFPFAGRHASLLPAPDSFHPQFMTEELHSWLWDVMEELGQGIDGIVCGFNSTGGYASVNHFHGQLALEPEGLPVMDPTWSHNGGTKVYPAFVLRYTNRQACWQVLNHYIEQGIAHNLLFLPGQAYLFPRRLQGVVKMPKWSGGIAWSELSGRMVVTEVELIGEMSWTGIEEALESVTLGP